MKKYPLLFFLLVSNTCFSQINLSQGLVAYYPFSGNANDASGNSNNPVFNNATLTTDRFGNAGSAYSFNGTNNYIQIPNSTSLNPSSQISLCVWVKVQGFYNGPCRGNSILMKANTEGPPGYKLRMDENHYPGNYSCGSVVDFSHEFFYGLGQPVQSYSYPWVKTDQWYSIVYTYDGKTSRLYVDCKLQISNDIPGINLVNAEDLFIGKTNLAGYPYWFNGVMDEIRIYDRAINQTEIDAYGGCCKQVNSITHNPAAICAPATINLKDPSITLGSDPVLNFTYFKDADTTKPISNPSAIDSGGTYYIKGIGTGICTTIDPVIVTIFAAPITPSATLIQPACSIPTGTITITSPPAGTGNYYSVDQTSYANTSGIFAGLMPKNYNVTIKNADGCISSPTSVTINPAPVTPSPPVINEVNNCDGTSTLSTSATGALLWSNNATGQSITVTPGTYSVTQTMNGCTSLPATITISTAYNTSGYFMPTAFTPNGDGINDCFGLKYWGNVTELDFSIYNRFGERVFHSTNAANCWDGRYKGHLQETASFVYLIKAKTPCGSVDKKGTVFLVR